MSDDFDDDEVQHRLIIDDHLDSSDNSMHTSKHNDVQLLDFGENGMFSYIVVFVFIIIFLHHFIFIKFIIENN